MSSNKNENELLGLGLTPKAIRQDLLHFKEEVLKDIKVVQKEFANKFGKMEDILKEQIDVYESKVNTFEQRIMNLTNLISADRSLIQKIEELVKFREETNDKLVTDSIRLTNLETDFKVNIKNIENILSKSVIYPGIIGYSGKFKSFHDFMDYVLKQISDLILFKEKSTLDLGPYKKKIDDTLEFVKIQVNHIIGSANEFTIKSVNDAEQRMRSLVQLYDDRLQDTRVENANYSIGLQKKSEELSRLIDNVYEIKKDIYKKLKDEVDIMKVDQKQLMRYFTAYRKQFTLIKDKFAQLSEFIRDVRFRANIAPDAKKRDFVNMAKQLDLRGSVSSNLNPFSKRKKFDLWRDESSDLNDIFESPEQNNRFFTNSGSKNKRNSVQIGLSSFSNRLADKFNVSNKKDNTLYKNPMSSSVKFKKSLTKNINDEVNDIFDSGVKKNNYNRRNTTAILIPNKLNKEFSQFGKKNSNIDFYNFKKEKEDTSINSYSSKSSSEEKNDKEKNKSKYSVKKPMNKEKNQYIIKEEDENNNSEITEDNIKNKQNKDSKVIKEDKKRNSKIENDKEAQENDKVKSEPEKEEKEKNKDENIVNKSNNNKENKDSKENSKNNKDSKDQENKTNDETKNEKEKEKEKEEIKEKVINENENDKKKGNENKINMKLNINKTRNSQSADKNLINPNIHSEKILNKKDKIVKFQENNETSKRDNERMNTVAIVNINDMFMSSNLPDKTSQFLKTANNYFFAFAQESEYKKPKPSTRKSATNKIPSSAINSHKSSPNSFNNTKDNFFNKKYEQYNELENKFFLDKSGQAYKTYTTFPKLQFDGQDKKKQNLNRKVIVLNNPKNKQINYINNFLNEKVGKISLSKRINPYNYINKGFEPPYN